MTLARLRTLYVADLWDVPTAGALGLAVERMVPTHGAPLSRAEMEHGLAMRRGHLEPDHAH